MSAIVYERAPSTKESKKPKILIIESMEHPQIRTEENELKKHATVEVIRIRKGGGISILLRDLLKNANLVLIGLLRTRCPPIPSTTFFGSLLLSAQIIKLTKKRTYSVFYGQWLFPAGIAALIAGQATGKKVINAAWGYDIQVSRSDTKYGISRLPQRIMSKITIQHSDVLIVNHEVHKQIALELIQKDSDDRIRYVPPSINLENFHPQGADEAQTRRRLGLPPDSPVVLFSPHLMHLYGILDLLAAIPLVLQKTNKVHFVLVGDGGLKGHVSETLDRKNLSQKVHILGKIQPTMMPKIYAIADLVCDLCYAGQGTTTLEALASGVPVVGMRSRKCLIVDGFNGYLATPNDPGDLAEKITQILSRPQLKAKMGLNARTSAQTYDPAKRAEALIKSIAELTGQSGYA